MRFAGVLVGVSSQQDASIESLKFAARDARALAAMLADGNEAQGEPIDDIVVLVNEEATRTRVLDALRQLAVRSQTAAYGLVLVHFSGHGTPAGQLVLHDTLGDDLDDTSLPIGDLTAALADLRAENLVMTFDSCFSGAALGLEGSANAAGFEAAMAGLAGESRSIIWAADPSERARENARLQHGYLTAALLDALRAPAVHHEPSFSLTTWLETAMRSTKDQTAQRGLPQHPAGRLALAPRRPLPAIPVGRHQRALEEDLGIHEVAGLADLPRYGFSVSIVAALAARLGANHDLNGLQREAIAPAGLLTGKNVVARAPTTAGKTLIGELAALRQFGLGRKAIILLPMRALVHEQADAFKARYGHLGIRIARSTGEANDEDGLLHGQHFDVAFLTYEKFATQIVVRPALLDGVGTIVCDEVQLLTDKQRGRTVELILARILRRRRAGYQHQILALCADVGSLNRLHEWLQGRAVGEGPRPIRLAESVVSSTGHQRFCAERGAEEQIRQLPSCAVSHADLPAWDREAHLRARVAVALARDLIATGQRVLIFRTSRSRVRALARELGRELGLLPSPVADELRGHPASVEASRATLQLLDCLDHGVGFHSADLDRHEREALEEAFRERRLQVLVATTTLAMGVNTPANAVIIADQSFWSPSEPNQPLTVTEYRNMAGRAGRWMEGIEEGTAFLIAEGDRRAEELWTTYVTSPGETLRSALGCLPAVDLAVALLTIAGRATLRDLVQVAAETFWGYHEQAAEGWRAEFRGQLETALDRLFGAGFVVRRSDDHYELTAIGRICGASGLLVQSADRVLAAVDRMKAADLVFGDGELVALTQLTAELDATFTRLAPGEEYQWLSSQDQWLSARPALGLSLQAADGPQARRIAACRLKRLHALRAWLDGRPPAQVEDLFEDRGDVPALSHVRAIAERSADLLRPVAALVGARMPERDADLAQAVERMVPRLELGVTIAAADLHRLNLRLTRSQTIQLVREGIATEAALYEALDANDIRLERIITTAGMPAFRDAAAARRQHHGRRAGPPPIVLDLFERQEF